MDRWISKFYWYLNGGNWTSIILRDPEAQKGGEGKSKRGNKTRQSSFLCCFCLFDFLFVFPRFDFSLHFLLSLVLWGWMAINARDHYHHCTNVSKLTGPYLCVFTRYNVQINSAQPIDPPNLRLCQSSWITMKESFWPLNVFKLLKSSEIYKTLVYGNILGYI